MTAPPDTNICSHGGTSTASNSLAGSQLRGRCGCERREPILWLRPCRGVTTTSVPSGRHHAMERPPPDEQLLAASGQDPQQFAPLFDRHASDIHHYLSRRVDSVADDLLSETFLVAFRQRGSYREAGAGVRAWLFGIATNLARQHVRAEIRRYRALARLPAPGPIEHDLTERLDAHQLRARIAAVLAELKPPD